MSAGAARPAACQCPPGRVCPGRPRTPPDAPARSWRRHLGPLTPALSRRERELAGERSGLQGDQEAAFDLASQNRGNRSREVTQGDDLGDLIAVLWFQISAEALPDALA